MENYTQARFFRHNMRCDYLENFLQSRTCFTTSQKKRFDKYALDYSFLTNHLIDALKAEARSDLSIAETLIGRMLHHNESPSILCNESEQVVHVVKNVVRERAHATQHSIDLRLRYIEMAVHCGCSFSEFDYMRSLSVRALENEFCSTRALHTSILKRLETIEKNPGPRTSKAVQRAKFNQEKINNREEWVRRQMHERKRFLRDIAHAPTLDPASPFLEDCNGPEEVDVIDVALECCELLDAIREAKANDVQGLATLESDIRNLEHRSLQLVTKPDEKKAWSPAKVRRYLDRIQKRVQGLVPSYRKWSKIAKGCVPHYQTLPSLMSQVNIDEVDDDWADHGDKRFQHLVGVSNLSRVYMDHEIGYQPEVRAVFRNRYHNRQTRTEFGYKQPRKPKHHCCEQEECVSTCASNVLTSAVYRRHPKISCPPDNWDDQDDVRFDYVLASQQDRLDAGCYEEKPGMWQDAEYWRLNVLDSGRNTPDSVTREVIDMENEEARQELIRECELLSMEDAGDAHALIGVTVPIPENLTDGITSFTGKAGDFVESLTSFVKTTAPAFFNTLSAMGKIKEVSLLISECYVAFTRSEWLLLPSIFDRLLRLFDLTKQAAEWCTEALMKLAKVFGHDDGMPQNFVYEETVLEGERYFDVDLEPFVEDAGDAHGLSNGQTALAAISTLVAGFVGTWLFGIKPEDKRIANVASQLRSMKFIKDSVKDLLDAFKCAIDYLAPAAGEWLEECFPSIFEAEYTKQKCVRDWLERATKYGTIDHNNLLLTDPGARVEVLTDWEMAQKCFAKSIADNKGTTLVLRAYENTRKAIDHISKVANSDGGRRIEPFVIAFAGPSGVGKSTVVRLLPHLLMPEEWGSLKRKPEESDADWQQRRLLFCQRNAIYAKGMEDQYYSGLRRDNWMFLVDDFDAVKSGGGSVYNASAAMIQLASSNQAVLNMADLQDKGTMFCSPLIVLTTNQMYCVDESIRHAPALLRRRTMLVRVTCKEEYGIQVFTENGSPSHFRVDPSKVPEDGVSHYEFQLYDPMRNQKIGPVLGFRDFAKTLKRSYDAFHKVREIDASERQDVFNMINEIKDEVASETPLGPSPAHPNPWRDILSTAQVNQVIQAIRARHEEHSVYDDAEQPPEDAGDAHGVQHLFAEARAAWAFTEMFDEKTKLERVVDILAAMANVFHHSAKDQLPVYYKEFVEAQIAAKRDYSEYAIETEGGRANFVVFLSELRDFIGRGGNLDDQAVADQLMPPHLFSAGFNSIYFDYADTVPEAKEFWLNKFEQEYEHVFDLNDPQDRCKYRDMANRASQEIQEARNRRANMNNKAFVDQSLLNIERAIIQYTFVDTTMAKVVRGVWLGGLFSVAAGMGYFIVKMLRTAWNKLPSPKSEVKCIDFDAVPRPALNAEYIPQHRQQAARMARRGAPQQSIIKDQPQMNSEHAAYNEKKATSFSQRHAIRTVAQPELSAQSKAQPLPLLPSMTAEGQPEIDKRSKIYRNLFRIGTLVQKDEEHVFYDSCFCLGLVDRLIVAPKHIFCTGDGKGLKYVPKGTAYMIQQDSFRTMFYFDQSQTRAVEGYDLLFVLLPAPSRQFPDITKYLVRHSDWDAYGDVNGYMYQLTNEMLSKPCEGIVVENEDAKYRWKHQWQYVLRITQKSAFKYMWNREISQAVITNVAGFSYPIAMGPGACGSPVVSAHDQHQRHIMGIHIAGTQGLGYGIPVFAETVEAVIKELLPLGPIRDCDEPIEIYAMDAQACFEAQGNLQALSAVKAPFSPRTPTDTHLDTSVLYNEIYENVMEPSDLSVHQLEKGFNKYKDWSKPIDPALRHVCRLSIAERFKRACPRNMLCELDWNRTLNGDPLIKHMDSSNVTSSAGIPFKLYKPPGMLAKGKRFLFNINDQYQQIGEEGRLSFGEGIGETLLAKMERDIAQMKSGMRVNHLFWDCTKDELRPFVWTPLPTGVKLPEGIYEGDVKEFDGKLHVKVQKDTRVFDVCSVDFLYIGRKFFLGGFAALMAAREAVGIAVGMDPFSGDAHKAASYLQEVGPRMIAGDYKQYDSHFPADLMEDCGFIMNYLYDDSAENQMLRRVWMSELYFRRVVVGDLCYEAYTGNPSGNPGTTIFNCIGGLMILMMAFIRLAERFDPSKAHPEAFWTWTRPLVFGDDFVLGVSDSCDWVTLPALIEAVKEFNMTMTPEDKSDKVEDWKPLERVTFLKCNFRMVDSIWRMCLSKKTIYEMLNWVSASTDKVTTTHGKCVIALWMMSWWGREDFDDLREKVVKQLCEFHDCKLPVPQFEIFDWQIQKCQDMGFTRQSYNEVTEEVTKLVIKSPFVGMTPAEPAKSTWRRGCASTPAAK